jgi:hypothetical protein
MTLPTTLWCSVCQRVPSLHKQSQLSESYIDCDCGEVRDPLMTLHARRDSWLRIPCVPPGTLSDLEDVLALLPEARHGWLHEWGSLHRTWSVTTFSHRLGVEGTPVLVIEP